MPRLRPTKMHLVILCVFLSQKNRVIVYSVPVSSIHMWWNCPLWSLTITSSVSWRSIVAGKSLLRPLFLHPSWTHQVTSSCLTRGRMLRLKYFSNYSVTSMPLSIVIILTVGNFLLFIFPPALVTLWMNVIYIREKWESWTLWGICLCI